MRAAAYAVAACQRGKRSLALDINAPEARPVVERLLRWADVVLHNFRVGVVRAAGHRRGDRRPRQPERRLLPRQRLRLHRSAGEVPGERRAHAGGDRVRAGRRRRGQRSDRRDVDPDRHVRRVGRRRRHARRPVRPGARAAAASAWRRACSAPACCCRAVCSSATASCVRGPELDQQQTGYGPGYRIYECGDGNWLALVAARPRRVGPSGVAARGRRRFRRVRAAPRRDQRRHRPRGGGRARGGVRHRAGGRVDRPVARTAGCSPSSSSRSTGTPSGAGSSTTR